MTQPIRFLSLSSLLFPLAACGGVSGSSGPTPDEIPVEEPIESTSVVEETPVAASASVSGRVVGAGASLSGVEICLRDPGMPCTVSGPDGSWAIEGRATVYWQIVTFVKEGFVPTVQTFALDGGELVLGNQDLPTLDGAPELDANTGGIAVFAEGLTSVKVSVVPGSGPGTAPGTIQLSGAPRARGDIVDLAPGYYRLTFEDTSCVADPTGRHGVPSSMYGAPNDVIVPVFSGFVTQDVGVFCGG